MYSRKNVHPDSLGLWISEDGEYEFARASDGWHVRRRDAKGSRFIGTGRTLSDAFGVAAKHYMTPAGDWEIPQPSTN